MSIEDKYGTFSVGPTSPIFGGFSITPDDNSDLPTTSRALMIAEPGGDVTVVMKSGETLTLPSLVAGNIYPFRVVRVLATGTNATGIVGLY